jgi:quercetin dioxygenase-like cupin family protein
MASREPAIPTILIDNDRVRVTEWRFPPGSATGWHKHEMDYIVTPMTTGVLSIEASDGTATDVNLVAGQPYFRQIGVEHDVVNVNAFEFVFIETELKR